MKARAWDYISKTGSSKKFRFALERAVEYRRQKKDRFTGFAVEREICRISGLSRGHLYRLMKQYDITPHADS